MLLEINPENPEPRKIQRAVDSLRAGDIIAYPTDTVYGIGCDLFNKKALDRLYQMKGLPRSRLLSFMCRDLADVSRYAMLHDDIFRQIKRHLPGPFCFILNATREVPRIVQSSRKTVGIRVPDHPVTQALLQELGHPIVNTTAARPNQDPHLDPAEIDDEFPGLALVLDAGPGGVVPSSVVDMTGDDVVVLREGAGNLQYFR
jgi:tRNA threonylcarbamoyl adenosine modification protein (Sua5/YciO/YrdC/YwlC family)